MLPWIETKPAGVARRFRPLTFRASVLRVLEGRPDRSGLEWSGLQHRHHAGLLPLIDGVALDAAVLDHHHAGLRPFAVLGESYLADVGVEGVRVDVLGEL